VSRVIAAPKPRNDVVIFGIKIDDAAFPLIAPLYADDNIGL
jgi:hypothetical protein